MRNMMKIRRIPFPIGDSNFKDVSLKVSKNKNTDSSQKFMQQSMMKIHQFEFIRTLLKFKTA